jgi:hypothetical protein
VNFLHRIWDWLTYPHRLTQRLSQAEEVRDLYKGACFTTLMQLRARESEVRFLRHGLLDSKGKSSNCLCCK